MPTRIIDRRGEAHLWLVLEEALGAARGAADADGVLDARRMFRNVADALIVCGAIEQARAEALVQELDDTLAVRGLLSPRFFWARPFPVWEPEAQPVRRRGDGWLEAEIEHHLDLVVDLEPVVTSAVARRVLEMLRPAERALQSAGSLPHGTTRLADLAATFVALGLEVDGPFGDADKGWLGFLRDRPSPLTETMESVASTVVRAPLGTLDGRPVVVQRLAWSEAVLEISVEIPDLEASSLFGFAWRCSAFDDAGRLHLGRFDASSDDPANPVVFRLRPGLMAGVSSLSVRVTHRAERLEEQISL